VAINLRNGQYACSICGEKYSSTVSADSCRDSHDIVYIPMTRTEFNRLINALALSDLSIIPDSLMETFRKYQKSMVGG